jgi:ketosteroid isomerase-like protein
VTAARARTGATALCAALAVAAGACGQDEGEASAVRAAAREYFAALAQGDARRACELLTDDVRKQFVARVAAITSAPDCESALQTLLKGRGGNLVKRVARVARIGDVKVDGDTATAKLSSNAQEVDVRLRRQDGAWRVDEPPTS